MEVIGDPKEYWATIHTGGLWRKKEVQARIDTPDLSEEFHSYGVKWTDKEITWYFDGRRVATTPTPTDMHKPMYLLVNLAVGGTWPKAPDENTHFPAEFHVARIRVFQPPVNALQK